MKKKLLTTCLISLFMTSSVLFGCSSKKTFTVTFKQSNVSDIVMKVEEGKELSEVPAPNSKTGYTVSWDRTDFKNINEDIVVNAIEVANKYIVTYNAEGYWLHRTTVELTYDAKCTALDMSLTKADHIFAGWKYSNTIYNKDSIWNVPDNVTITAEWQEREKVTITFIDSNGTNIVKTIYKGDDLTDVPTVTPKAGYKVYWDRNDFKNIQQSIVVNAVLAKIYTVTLDPNEGTTSPTSVTVTYGESYTLPEPVHEEYKFASWKYNEQNVPLSGKWNINVKGDTIALLAEWGESKWTIIH